MPRVAPLQSDFSGGELTPLAQGRVESPLYKTCLDTCLNYWPIPQGGLIRRPGTIYSAKVKTSSKKTRLVEFEFSTTQAYVLEFGDRYIRVYKDHAQVMSGGSPYEVSTPYLEADLFQLKFTQSNDVLFITHPSYAQRSLSRTSDTAWTLTTLTFSDGPYLGLNTESTSLSVTGSQTRNISDIVYADGLYVAICETSVDGSAVLTSTDGLNWTARSSPTTGKSIAYGNGLYVTVGNNTAMTSPDGKNWIEQTPATASDWRGVAYGNGVFVAVTSNNVMTSSDGVTWTTRTPATSNFWQGITYGAQFVAVSTTGTGDRVMTSPDGVTWTSQTSAADLIWEDVAYGDDTYVAVAASGTGNRVMTSPDGVTWTSQTSAADNAWYSIAYGNGVFVAVAGTGSGNRIMVSSDKGVTWATKNNIADNDYRAVVYGGKLFVTVGYIVYSSPGALTSADGSTWSGSNNYLTYVSGSVTVTATDTAGINDGAGFVSTDVGRVLRIYGKQSSTWGWGTITAVTDTKTVTATAHELPTGGSEIWRLGLWSDTTGYPAAVVFHEDRLIFAGTTDYPQRIDGSRSGDYYNFAPSDNDGTVTDSHAISFTLNARQVNVIHWILSDEKGLLIGTAGAEWVLRPSTRNEALSPTNVSAQRVTEYGSANIQAISAGKTPIFIQRLGRKVREMKYTYASDGFEGPDLTILAEHVTQGGIVEMARQAEPFSILWMVRNDGVLIGFTYSGTGDNIKIAAHRHILGGVSDAAGSAPIVESVASIPDPTGAYDEVWVVVKRYINGATVRYVEYFAAHFDESTALEDASLLDCAVLYSGASTTTITGLSHLEGETVAVFGDGFELADATVASGQATIARASTKVLIGYSYNSDGKLLRQEAGSASGTSLGKPRRIHKMGLLLYRTLGLKAGMSFSDTDLDQIVFRRTTDYLGSQTGVFSGVQSFTVEADYDFDNQFCWRQDGPFPGTILAAMPQMETQDP